MNKMYLDLEKRMIKIESSYSKYATLDKESIRLKKETKDFRPNFFRDADRIIILVVIQDIWVKPKCFLIV